MKTIVTIGLLSALLSTAHGATIFSDGFEPGGGTPNVATDPAASGNGGQYIFAYNSLNTSHFLLANSNGDGVALVAGTSGFGGDSTQFAVINNVEGHSTGSITSTSPLTTITAGDSYTLSVDIGNEPGHGSGQDSGTVTLNLYAGSIAPINLVATSGLTNSASIADGTYTTYRLSLNSVQTLALGGQSLNLEIDVTAPTGGPSGKAYQTSFDNITLSDPATVPEPSTYALVGCGLVGLLAIRRLRNLSRV